MALSTCHGAKSKKGQVPRVPGGGGKPRGKELRDRVRERRQGCQDPALLGQILLTSSLTILREGVNSPLMKFAEGINIYVMTRMLEEVGCGLVKGPNRLSGSFHPHQIGFLGSVTSSHGSNVATIVPGIFF